MSPRVMRFISTHDESWPFFFLFLALSIILSVFFNLGFFLILILVHFLLDFLKHWHSNNRTTNSARRAAYYAFRDGFLFDFFLFSIAFALGFIFHFTFAASLSNSVRLLQLVELENLLRILSRLVVADWIVENIARLTVYVKEIDKRKTYMTVKLSDIERLFLAGSFLIVLVTAILPLVMGAGYETFWHYLNVELIPRLRFSGV